MNPVTVADEAKFVGFIEKWQALLNLGDWRIEPSPKGRVKKLMAQVELQPEDHLAKYRLGESFRVPVTDATLESVAVHELLHVLFSELLTAYRTEDTAEGILDGLEHGVVVTLEKLLMNLQGQRP